MQANLFDLALLSVLTLFFGVLQAQRPQREYRMWLTGWVLVMCSLLVYLPRHLPSGWLVVQECLRVDVLIFGSVVFLLSFAERKTSRKRLALDMIILSAIPCLLVNCQDSAVGGHWLYVALTLAGQVVVMGLAQNLLNKRATRNLIQGLSLVGTIGLLAAIWLNQPDLVVAVLLVQNLGGCLILLIGGSTRARSGKWTSAVGFLLWASLYVVYEITAPYPIAASILSHIWTLPKYMVGFGMILMVIEEDSFRISALSEEYRLLYESNPHPMSIYEPVSARFLSVNEAAIAAYGYTREEFLQMTVFDIRPKEDHERFSKELVSMPDGKLLGRHLRKNGEVFDVEITGHDVAFQGSTARFVMAIDITEREQLNRELVYSAQHDVLTGLANRILLEERAEQALARSARDGSRTAVLTIDVDRFKQVNDTYGHLVGDECLKAIASRLESRVRLADTLARTGGEEFTVLVSGLGSVKGAQAAAAALLATLSAPLVLSTNEIVVSVSIGIAIYPDDGADLETIRKRSDKALYTAKRMGGGRAVLASEEHAGEARAAVDIESAIREGLQTGGFALVYQPIFAASGRFARVEALVRGKAEYLSKIGPANFIPVAEESGLILPLGRWVLEEACRQMAEWRTRDLPVFELAVNVSARQLVQADFTEQVLATLERYQLPAALLHLELTETTLMHDFSTMIRSMKRLAQAGVLFSIDDFGTGYSSLARLSELPISTLKVDRSFVTKLLESEAAVGIVRAIVHMSRNMNLEVVAEGVEQPEHIAMLLNLGCHMFQGFYLSRPLTPEALEATLTGAPIGFDPRSFRNVAETTVSA